VWSRLVPDSPLQTVALALVAAFFGGAVVWAAPTVLDRPPAEDSVEVGFLRDMFRHHEQAVSMSMDHIDGGSETGAGLFSREIVYFQSYEMGLMHGKVRDWGHDIQADRPAMEWMDMPSPAGDMPGMASEDELAALREAKDPESADALFFALMRDHHLGGVAMAEYAVEHSDDAWVRDLATRMANNQRAEVGELDRVRERLGLSASPAGYEPDPQVGEEHATHGDDGD
jgi:uncharacterized protein (DUF305 family)